MFHGNARHEILVLICVVFHAPSNTRKSGAMVGSLSKPLIWSAMNILKGVFQHLYTPYGCSGIQGCIDYE